MALSLAGTKVLMGILTPILVILVVVIVINVLQGKHGDYICQCPSCKGIKIWLPNVLRNWDFLPLWMHSLDPVDRLLRKIGSLCCGCCAERFSFLAVKPEIPEVRVDSGYENFGGTGSSKGEGNVNPAFHGDAQVSRP